MELDKPASCHGAGAKGWARVSSNHPPGPAAAPLGLCRVLSPPSVMVEGYGQDQPLERQKPHGGGLARFPRCYEPRGWFCSPPSAGSSSWASHQGVGGTIGATKMWVPHQPSLLRAYPPGDLCRGQHACLPAPWGAHSTPRSPMCPLLPFRVGFGASSGTKRCCTPRGQRTHGGTPTRVRGLSGCSWTAGSRGRGRSRGRTGQRRRRG